ncbi:histidine kinase [Paenibacillus athensensis]|uniref:sensor histidine kinase n=1 Tax=Paenibacillus athensensis TaxID=1967502 RepID=UPI00106F68BF|nr:sensor histidine kinase [Paenibacillus athensensis]MCD1258689.1 histidine kinase [Paenibacillus athensensis]
MFPACSNSYDKSANAQPAVQGGLIELEHWSFAEEGPVELSGEWDFYWQQLLAPEQLQLSGPEDTMRVPRLWNGVTAAGKEVTGKGFATYHIRIETEPTWEYLAVRLPAIPSAYRMWVDDRLVALRGAVGSSRDSSSPCAIAEVVNLHRQGGAFTITLQVSNFDLQRGGLPAAPLLGTEQQLQSGYTREMIGQLFLIGCTFMMGLYHLGVFALRRRERSMLYFGLFCLLVGFRAFFTGGYLLHALFSDMGWLTALKIEYLSSCLSVMCGFCFVHAIYPNELPRMFVRLGLTFTLLVGALITVMPAHVFTGLDWLLQGFTVLALLGVMFAVGRAVRQKREGAGVTAIGVSLYAVTIIAGILEHNEWLQTGDVTPTGLLLVIFFHSLLICFKFMKSYATQEEMSEQLRELNSGLEAKIQERTLVLEQYNLSLMKMNEELARMEMSRKHLLTNISHDLGTPMTLIQGYVEALMDGVVEDPGQQRKYLQIIHARVSGLHRLIQDLFQLSKLEARQVSFTLEPMEVGRFIRHVNERYETEIQASGIRAEIMKLDLGNAEEERCVRIDLVRMDQVFTNIIVNAIKYTPQGGVIRISFTIEGAFLQVRIDDSGIGIAPEDLPYVFDRFYKKEKSRNLSSAGTGLGLAIAKEIVDFHGGTIWIDNSRASGTSVCFLLPIERTGAVARLTES